MEPQLFALLGRYSRDCNFDRFSLDIEKMADRILCTLTFQAMLIEIHIAKKGKIAKIFSYRTMFVQNFNAYGKLLLPNEIKKEITWTDVRDYYA